MRFRLAPGNVSSVLANCSAAYNVLYRTTDALNDASWAVTTLLAPINMTNSPNEALVSVQIPYDSADVDQSPSYLLQDPAQASSALDITGALGRGWFVNVPDYEGPLAAFAAEVQAGHATLDSIRSILHLAKHHPNIGLSPKARYAMWGYSGGSMASEFAAELQPSYAPDLHFVGAVLGGTVTVFEHVWNLLEGTQYIGLMASALVGVVAEFPDAREFLVSKLKTSGPYNATTFLAVPTTSSTFEVFAAFAYQHISDYFVDGEADVFDPILLNLYDTQTTMGLHGVPSMPLFLYKAIGDQFSLINDTDVLVEKYCGLGVEILYERNTVGDHMTEQSNGHTRSLDWLAMAFNGNVGELYENQSCTVVNVTQVVDR